MEGFSNLPFIDKEAAAFNPLRFLRRGVDEVADVVTAPKQGKFVTNPAGQVGHETAGNVRMYDQEEIAKQMRNEVNMESNGLVGDLITGTTGLVTPKSWGAKEKMKDGLFAMKNFLTDVDTKAGKKIAGNDPSSWRGKFHSVRTGGEHRGGIQIGEKTNADGSITPIMEGGGMDRRPSLIGPYKNTVAVASPFLAAAYVGDKLYPTEEIDQTNKEAEELIPFFEKKAKIDSTEYANHGILKEEYIPFQLDKEASFQKIAMLTDELEKVAVQMEHLNEEVQLLSKEASYEREEKLRIKESLDNTQRMLIEKKAAHDEFRLRILARERSKAAVKLAEDMLEEGIIKQAGFDEQVDKLMDCDQETFNLYTSMVKEARFEEEGLESLTFLVDYRSNGIDSQQTDSHRGLSKRGQTIGEAARDLIK